MKILLLFISLCVGQTVDLKRPMPTTPGTIGFVRYAGKPPSMHVLKDYFANRVTPPAAPGACGNKAVPAWALPGLCVDCATLVESVTVAAPHAPPRQADLFDRGARYPG